MERRNLKGERIKAGYTQEEFAEELGVAKNTIWYLETGRQNGSYELWLKIQELLKLDNSQMWDLYLKQA